MIHFQGISKTYNGVKALNNIDLKIAKGDFVFLVGPTGSGKSTLIKLLYREELATSGQLMVFGKDIEKMTKKAVPLLRQQTGVVFQDFKLLAQKTVWENVAFVLEIMGLSKAEQQKRIQGVLDLTHLNHAKDQYPHQLSGGEQQRVSIARAIVNRPPLLLADEPTGNLDPEASWSVMKLLSKIGQTGTTVVVSTHNMSLVHRMKRRTVQLKAGEIVADYTEGTFHHGS